MTGSGSHRLFWVCALAGGLALGTMPLFTHAVAFGLPLYWEGIFIGAILTATSVSISAQTLLEIGAPGALHRRLRRHLPRRVFGSGSEASGLGKPASSI